MSTHERELPRRIRHFLFGCSLASRVEAGRDNILQLRLLAALFVILGHSYVLVGGGASSSDPVHALFPGTYTHLVGVMMFFVISGFLITLSWQRRPELWRFLCARALRLWPGLFVCVVAWALVLGPVLTNLPLPSYFGRGDQFGSVWGHIAGNISLLRMHWFLPGVFASTPVARYVNGSLWTIPLEATLYVCVAGLGVTGMFRFPRVASVLLCMLFGWLVFWPMYMGHFVHTGLTWMGIQLAGFFAAGSIACLLRQHVPVSSGLMIVVAAVCLAGQRTTHGVPLTMLLVTYFVFWFAYVPRLPSIPQKIDASYGVYLWGFPTQQMLVLAGVSSAWILFAAATPILLVTGTLSWLYVEKPMLRMKDWGWRGQHRKHADALRANATDPADAQPRPA